MTLRQRLAGLLHLLSAAVVSQAILSAASLLIGLMLIRRSSDLEYGYYILAANTVLLLASLQNAFFAPSLANRLARLDRAGRSDAVGGLYRAQRRILPPLVTIACLAVAVLWRRGLLDTRTGPVALAVVAVAAATLTREYFRMVLINYRLSLDVLKGDSIYVFVLLAATAVATLTPGPALGAVLGLGAAATACAVFLSRTLRRHEPWNINGAPFILREIAPMALWSTLGAAVHWAFSQGYPYLVAATLGVSAVASVAATRLLMMPVNLLSSGLGMLMLPMASIWLVSHGAPTVLRRLSLMAGAVAGAALCYLVLLWPLREWIFASILKKQFDQRDPLLLLWSATFLTLAVRDQLIYLLVARCRFRTLTIITSLSAVLSLLVSYWAMRRYGTIGAPCGVLVGELANVCGILVLSLRETARTELVSA